MGWIDNLTVRSVNAETRPEGIVDIVCVGSARTVPCSFESLSALLETTGQLPSPVTATGKSATHQKSGAEPYSQIDRL